MGIVRRRSSLAGIARRLRSSEGSRSEIIEPVKFPPGYVFPSASLKPAHRYPRHGFGQEWSR